MPLLWKQTSLRIQYQELQNLSVPLGMPRDVAIYEQSTQVWVTMYHFK